MQPLDRVTHEKHGVGFIYAVSKNLNQATVAFTSLDGALTAVGIPFLKPHDGMVSETDRKVLVGVRRLIEQLKL